MSCRPSVWINVQSNKCAKSEVNMVDNYLTCVSFLCIKSSRNHFSNATGARWFWSRRQKRPSRWTVAHNLFVPAKLPKQFMGDHLYQRSGRRRTTAEAEDFSRASKSHPPRTDWQHIPWGQSLTPMGTHFDKIRSTGTLDWGLDVLGKLLPGVAFAS